MDKVPLQNFLSETRYQKVHIVLPGAVITGENQDLVPRTFILQLGSCTVRTGSSKVFIETLFVSADTDIIAWGIGDIQETVPKEGILHS
jgi:hypothetical protein